MPGELWLRLERNCPEVGRYSEGDLTLLASVILGFNDDYESEDELVEILKELPVGVIQNLFDNDVVRVQCE